MPTLSPYQRRQLWVRLDASVAEMATDYGVTPERMARYLAQPVPVTADDSDDDDDDDSDSDVVADLEDDV